MFRSLKSKEIENIFEIKKIFEEDGKKYIFFTKDVPEGRNSRKEFVRLSGLVGLTAWQTMPEEEKARNTGGAKVTKERLKYL